MQNPEGFVVYIDNVPLCKMKNDSYNQVSVCVVLVTSSGTESELADCFT
jgi:hypothetical protein